MKRGEVWTAAGGADYLGKPRPIVILQDDRFGWTDSVTVCGFTTIPKDAPLIRIRVEPSPHNGLREPCYLMVDKISTMPRSKLGRQIGRLEGVDLVRLDRVILVFLGLVTPSRNSAPQD